MRDNFINALINLAENDKEIVLLTGDLGFGVFEKFESSFPGQYFNVGVAYPRIATFIEKLNDIVAITCR